MAIATFHSLRGEKSALIMVKANKFVFSASPCYVPKSSVEGLKEGDTFEIPNGFKLVPIVDIETGVPRLSKDGHELMMLSY